MNTLARRACTAASLAFLLTAVGGSGISFADGTEPDGSTVVNTAEPESNDPADSDLVDVPADQVDKDPDIPGSGDGPGNHPHHPDCEPANIYTPSSKGKDYQKGVGAAQANTNKTGHMATSTFTAEVTGTVGVSISGSLTTSVSIMIAKIETKYDVSLSASLTTKLGNSTTVHTPTNRTTHARYGVYRLKATGTSYRLTAYCQTSPKVTVVSYTPDFVGWYTWETKA
ncbi:hypothetical protein [Streptomyces avermitilis]|uniref:hypothetical protein n=1 Tax=Streptomyces avermitilis TaxID=33903 RepID=UPI0037209285